MACQGIQDSEPTGFFLITPNLALFYTTKECNIMHTPFSDHYFITLNLQSVNQPKRSGPGFWEFNASLLEDEKYWVRHFNTPRNKQE